MRGLRKADRLTERRCSVDEDTYSALRLTRGWVARDAKTSVRADLEISEGRISTMLVGNELGEKASGKAVSFEIDLGDYLILPGLLNAHDHLEFNLFPRVGSGPYQSLAEWAGDVYHPLRSPLREHLSVPKRVRLLWGGLKNLLSGVTTVCHHNPYEEEVFGEGFPIHVVNRYGWAHSLGFEANLAEAFDRTPTDAPFIIHLGEGTDLKSQEEIFELDRLGLLGPTTVIVHGVGLTAEGHALRRQRGVALVWCPTSNVFTLGRTLDAQFLGRDETIALGSDSALTARGDLLHEIKDAYQWTGLEVGWIYSIVTEGAASILRLRNGEGTIQEDATADLIAIKGGNLTPAETLVGADLEMIELVLVSGRPHLVSMQMAKRWPAEMLAGLEPVEIDGVRRLVRAPVSWMLRETKKAIGTNIRLAGRRVEA